MYHPITTFTNDYYSVRDNNNNIHDTTPNMIIKKEQDYSFNQGLLLTSFYYPNNHQLPNTSNASHSRHNYTYDCATYSPSSTSNSSLSPTDSTAYDFYPQFMDDHFFPTDSIFKNEEWILDSLLPTEPVTKTNDVRPYPCHLCRRAFARKHDLQRHIRVHTGDKPYSCPCCKKAFARTDALKRHLRMEEHCRTSHEVLNMKKNGGRHFRNLKIHTT
ncbi:hypothetical protein BDF21DRAFT_432435 [Thamnidium elegans]|uniref:C2H2-type domain-containing protein n=1 Tax=Thamnidium elegans TaxID=101142 RepID=A0A8H7SM96_9FUNG|nr:hypothetical protein INT48_005012 [Thamnidium elegans]KAI8050705.1 hypothetical protein BDF21DRAFT_432435 [Thamnidium elegans]